MTDLASPASSLHRANLLTYASLAAAFGALAAAERGSDGATAALLATAVVADTFDGRVASRFARSAGAKQFGVQLDSLADAVTFGAVPVVCASLLTGASTPAQELLWQVATFIYVACAITRLGFYNVSHAHVRGFIGLPSPVAALLWASAMLLGLTTTTASMIALAAGVAMIAPLRIPRPSGAGLALFVSWPIAIVLVGWLG